MLLHRWLLMIALSSIACADDPDSSTLPDAGAESDATVEETVDFDARSRRAAIHAGGSFAISQAKAVTSAFIKEDPTIDPQKSAAENADAIAAQIQAATATTCPTLTLTHAASSATLTVSFPTSGCSVNDVTVSGQVAIQVTAMTGLVKVSFQFTALSVEGHVLEGTVEESTTNGTTYSTKVTSLVADGVTYDYEGTQTLDGDLRGVTLNGSGSSSKSGDTHPTTYSVATVHQKFGACYPDSGTMSLTSKEDVTVGRRTVTVTTTESVLFDANTPSDGTVDVTVTISGSSPVTKTVTLPAYGECPP
ncbi:MAG: hypothetical protein HY791_07255 [Deltaproteobacteria bacterium]|nr:hypothetical protein [Deltaproteobacteria bacterium]